MIASSRSPEGLPSLSPLCSMSLRQTAESLVRLVANRIGFVGDLGKKERKGILRNQASREEFLTDRHHRIRTHGKPRNG